MTFPRKLGLLLLFIAVAAAAGYEAGLALPSLRWFFSFAPAAGADSLQGWEMNQARVVGHVLCGLMALGGLILIAFGGGFQWNPLTVRKLQRFRSIGRGYRSFVILVLLMIVAMLDQALVGKRALAVRYNGQWSFPAFTRVKEDGGKQDPAFRYGIGGEGEIDFRELKVKFDKENTGNHVWMPLIPFDPTSDTDKLQSRRLVSADGLVKDHRGSEPFSGIAYVLNDDNPFSKSRMATFRAGKLSGRSEIYDTKGQPAVTDQWLDGKLVEHKQQSDETPPALTSEPVWTELLYPPAPPSVEKLHFLGTDSRGWDVAAQLYGGFQVIVKASILYLLLTFGIGVVAGSLMGYFGGGFDLVSQRLIEIVSNVPFLYIVMIISANIGRDKITLVLIVLVLGAFSWIGPATYLRSQTFKEKARDYVSAARVLGGGTTWIIFRHVLPNTISTVITLLPFSVVTVATSLTALDYLGFGLPESYPSWGLLLSDGTANLEAWWIVTAVFVLLVLTLMLVTFVGEAVREAFDPKKFTYYR